MRNCCGKPKGGPINCSHRHTARFWVGPISLFTGMRLNEICALDLTDVQIVEGVPCFLVREPQQKQFKLYDDGGLFVIVTPAGGKLWRLKYRFNGKEQLEPQNLYLTCKTFYEKYLSYQKVIFMEVESN